MNQKTKQSEWLMATTVFPVILAWFHIHKHFFNVLKNYIPTHINQPQVYKGPEITSLRALLVKPVSERRCWSESSDKKLTKDLFLVVLLSFFYCFRFRYHFRLWYHCVWKLITPIYSHLQPRKTGIIKHICICNCVIDNNTMHFLQFFQKWLTVFLW